ncbi:leucine-rich repeat and immunoglobulin-like domain-containing nogo receptor-interacting protein 2 [Frankliniella occidentalis]|uniref:Leucine-rich repeat and immunoglobulin-like domain-containing nogo receptor-interacting protein 2 n=1 Tax=Frankliniella occidentalis TaxID=133901 RepID=A0A9C6X7L8_FRAOC|nr:leucine-rich repeat and immunoglobulin-like domain-containing nogo receptor-interacting protein 2 [Frankliniella occidentalis]
MAACCPCAGGARAALVAATALALLLLVPVLAQYPDPEDETGPDVVGALASELVILERRVRALEQPVWMVSGAEDRWLQCCDGPCRCRPEMRSLSCWRHGLRQLPQLQRLPEDVRSIDLSVNRLSTLHKDAFRGLVHLTDLDLYDNELDFLPESLFESLDSLQHL